jgi:hypothetical protein
MKIINLDGNEIDYIEGMPVKMNDGIYYLMSEEEILANQPDLSLLKRSKLELLETAYVNAQYIRIKNGHTFMIPLKGDFFNFVIKGQIDSAKDFGSAPLVCPDISGKIQILKAIPYTMWEAFWNTAKPISQSNMLLKTEKQIEISNCNSEQLNLVNVNVFPAIQEIILDLPE